MVGYSCNLGRKDGVKNMRKNIKTGKRDSSLHFVVRLQEIGRAHV